MLFIKRAALVAALTILPGIAQAQTPTPATKPAASVKKLLLPTLGEQYQPFLEALPWMQRLHVNESKTEASFSPGYGINKTNVVDVAVRYITVVDRRSLFAALREIPMPIVTVFLSNEWTIRGLASEMRGTQNYRHSAVVLEKFVSSKQAVLDLAERVHSNYTCFDKEPANPCDLLEEGVKTLRDDAAKLVGPANMSKATLWTLRGLHVVVDGIGLERVSQLATPLNTAVKAAMARVAAGKAQ